MAEIFYITDSQGHTEKAGSVNEYYLSLAFHKLKRKFIYQYRLYGYSQGLRGGLKVDFVLLPFYEPVELFGNYWHKSEFSSIERLKLNREWQAFGFEPIIFWGKETETYQLALAAARKKLR